MGTRLVIAIVQKEDTDQLMRTVTSAGYACTRIGTTGGFLRKGNVTLLMGVDEAKVPGLIQIIRSTCRTRTHLAYPFLLTEPDLGMQEPIEVEVGGAVVFVLDVLQMLQV